MDSVFFKKDFYLRFADGKICGFGGIKFFLSVTAILFFATFFCVATDYKWKGVSSGSWRDAGNWNIIDENGIEIPATDCPEAGDSANFDSEVTITDSVSAGKIVAERGLVFNSDLSTTEIEIKGGNLSVGGDFSWSGNVSVSGDVEVSGSGFANAANLTSGGNIHFEKKYEGTNPSNIECAGEFKISGTDIADGEDSFLLRGKLSAKSIVIEGNKKTSFLGGCSSIITTETQTYGGNVLVNSDITIDCSSVTFGGNLVSHTKDSKKDVTITGDCVFKGTVGSEVSASNNEKIKNLSVSGSVTAYGDFYTSGTLTFDKDVVLAADDIVFSSENNISFKDGIKGNANAFGNGTVYLTTVTPYDIEIGGFVTDVNNVVFNGNVVLNSSVSAAKDIVFNSNAVLNSNISAKNDIVFNSDAVLNSSVSAEKDIYFNGGADSVKIGCWKALSSESGSIYFGSETSPVKVKLSNSSGTISVNTKNSGKTFFYGGFYDGLGLSVSGNAEIYGDNVFSGEVKLENCGIVEFYGNNTFSQKFFVKAENLASTIKFKNGSYQSFSSMELKGSSSANTVTLSVLDSSSAEKWYAVFSGKPDSKNFSYSIIDKTVSVVSVGSTEEKLLGLIPSDKTVNDSNPYSPTSETWFSHKYFWLGKSDSNWTTLANWAYDEGGNSPVFVCPSSDDGKSEIVVAKGNSSLSSPHILTPEKDVNLKSLTVNKDAAIDLQNFSVTCAENFTNNGTLWLKGEGQTISAKMANGPDSTVEYYGDFSDFVWKGNGTDYFEYENLKITGSGKTSQKIKVFKEVFVETGGDLTFEAENVFSGAVNVDKCGNLVFAKKNIFSGAVNIKNCGDLSFLGQNDFNGTVALLEAGNVVINGDSDGFVLSGDAKCKTLNAKCPVKLNGDVTTTETKTFEGIDCGQFYEKSVFVASDAVLTDKKAVYVKGGLSSQNKTLKIDANAFCESAIDGFLKLEITKTLKVEGNVGSITPLGTISVLEDAIFSSAEPVQKIVSLGNQKYSGKVTAQTGLEIKAGADGTNISGVAFSGFYVVGSLSVTADSAKLFCADYISSGNQVFNCSGGVKILSEKTGISGTWQSGNGKIELNETALILDFSDGSLENSFELKSELEAKDVFFYSGKLSVASGKTLKTGNFAAWGKNYSKTDSRFSAEENSRFAYFWDDTDSSILKYKENGSGAELSVNGAIFEISNNFYANGLDIEGLELKIPDNSSSNPQFNSSSEVTKNQWGIPYAVAFNSKITKTTVEGGWLAAGADSQNCEDGLQNSNVQFFVPKIKKAYSVYDDVIFVEFDMPLENSKGEIAKNIAWLKYSNGLEDFEGVYSDSDCTKKLTAADGDVSSFYLKGQNSWNTDATGTLPCSPALKSLVDSTDRKGVHKNLTTDLSFLEGIFTSADGHTMCENYGAGNKNGSVPERYTQTEDRASPVLIAVYTGQELHTNAKALAQKSYDSHNFIEFRYSEAVNIAFDDGTILQSEGGDSNIRATEKIGKTTGSGTQDENGNGLIVNGFASIENGKLLAFSKDDTDSPHALYRLFSTKAGEEDSIQTHRVRLSIAGWTDGTVSFSDSLNPSFNGEYLYWPGYIQKAETPTGIVYSLENSAISDLSGNIIDSNGTKTNHKLQVLTVNNYSSDGEKDVSKTDSLYGEWDVLCPVVAPVIKSETSWNSWVLGEEADSYEILGTSNTPSDTTLKFIEMHFFDNDKTQARKWNSWWRTRKGWNEDGKLPENRGGARPDDSFSNSKTLGGIRLCSLKNANSNFSYKIKKSDDSGTESETGEFSFEKETDISPVVYGNIFKEQHTKTQADGLYIRLPLSDKTLALRTTFEVYYSPQDSYITDLAGNLLSSSYTQKTKFTSLDVTPPSIVMTLAPIGENKIYAIFSKQLAFGSENKFFKNLSEADLKEALSQIAESFILVKKGSSAGASAEENAITKAEYVSSSDEYTALLFTLEKTINLSDVENLWLRNVGYNSQKVEDGVGVTVADTKIRDFLGNYMTKNSGHALSDFAVNALDVLYAYANPKDDDDWNEKGIYGQNTASVSSDYAVHDFTAEQGNYGALVEQRDIALQIKINGEMESDRSFLLVPSKSSALSSDMISDKINLLLGTDWRVWLPTSLKAVATHPNSYVMSENFPESADGGNGILWNYTLKNEDYGFKSGDEIQFLFKLTNAAGNEILLDNDADDFTGGSANPSHPVPLYALKMPLEKINAGDFSFVDLWSFKIKSIKQQRGGVTILNNVINVNAREQAVLEVNVPEEGNLNVFVMTVDGNIVKRLNHGRVNSGTHYYRWNGTNNASKPVARGLYFVRVVGPGIDETRKVLCVKE